MRTARFLAVVIGLLIACASWPSMTLAQNGNSAAAHACQRGGYAGLIGTGGETFANTGECVSYAAHGGTFATGIVIPAGQTLTFTAPTFSACNPLAYGYTINGLSTELGSRPYVCSTETLPDQVIGPFPTAVLVTVYLQDQLCGETYGSDGYHARVVASPPTYQVDIADGGGSCERVGVPAEFEGVGNLSVQLIVNP